MGVANLLSAIKLINQGHGIKLIQTTIINGCGQPAIYDWIDQSGSWNKVNPNNNDFCIIIKICEYYRLFSLYSKSILELLFAVGATGYVWATPRPSLPSTGQESHWPQHPTTAAYATGEPEHE